MAPHETAVPIGLQLRLLLVAQGLRHRTARGEPAPSRQIDRTGRVATKHDPFGSELVEWQRRLSRTECHRIRVPQIGLETLRRRELHDLAQVHHGDPVADGPYGA